MEQKNERKRALFIPFSVKLPITQILKTGDLFSTYQAGEIILEGRGRVDNAKIEGFPAAFGDTDWLSIDLQKIEYCGASLLPLLHCLPAARLLLESFESYAKGQVILIYNSKFAQ